MQSERSEAKAYACEVEITLSPPIEPMLEYVNEIARHVSRVNHSIVVPEFISNTRMTVALHMNTTAPLRSQLKCRLGIVSIDVPWHVHEGAKRD